MKGKHSISISGFWLFCQYTKIERGDRTKFKDFVLTMESTWEAMDEDLRKEWRELGRTLKKTPLGSNLKTIYRAMKMTRNYSDGCEHHDTYVRKLERMYDWIKFSQDEY